MITLERVSAVGRFDMGRSLFVVPQQPRAEAVTRKKSKLLLGPQKEKPALVQVDDVSDVEVVSGRLIHLIADESIRRSSGPQKGTALCGETPFAPPPSQTTSSPSMSCTQALSLSVDRTLSCA